MGKIELVCSECGKHLGWMTDTGPYGLVYCDDCAWDEEDG